MSDNTYHRDAPCGCLWTMQAGNVVTFSDCKPHERQLAARVF